MSASGDDSPESLMGTADQVLPFQQEEAGDSSLEGSTRDWPGSSSSSSSPTPTTGCSRLIDFSTDSSNLKFSSWLLKAPLFKEWIPVHHVYFQFSQLAILLLICMKLNKRQRLLIIAYAALLSCWGWFVLRSGDVFVWGIVLAAFNLFSALWSVCSDWPLRFRGENEAVYRKLFRPLKISRKQFRRVLGCKRNVKVLHAGDHYAVEKSTRVDSLALVLTGRLLVSQNSKPLHVIGNYQFVDSPEYFGVSTDELFQVTITALEDTKLIVWHRDKLRLTIMNDEFLRVVFDHVIGRDVVRKLIQVSDTVTTGNGGTPNLFSKENGDDRYIHEHDPMIDRKNGNNNGTEIWSLTKIDEETPV